MVVTKSIQIRTRGESDVVDITGAVEEHLKDSELSDGIVTIFVPGATGGVTTIEYESGAVRDLKDAFERLAPRDADYAHNVRWGDGNGFSHVRAAVLGPSLTMPFSDGSLIRGTWQQIVFVDFDNRSRARSITVQFMGE